ncbi:EamA family transporter [Halogeometricum limi]|uniref:Transporter family protein n=1 Tax=Halogeometricum limi TaxID=555875 RepID=A0A1I6GNB9_9EURY|nr:EamA family transporter [Halogeometricum limi]SFR43557.1 transporter family protein [Halogeometricum limi]
MSYLPWAVLALAAYAFVSPLMSVATTGSTKIPSNVAALLANSLLVVGTAAIVVYNDSDALTYLVHPKTKFVLAAGVCLTVGILAYYRALSMGPVSVVSPIFGMFLVLSSLVGVVFLNESLTARKALGIGLAVVAVYLVTVE